MSVIPQNLMKRAALSYGSSGSPTGNRTPVTAVKGPCLNRLTMGPKNRLRPTFPGSFPPSIIGSEGLNYCVRDGNRCDPNDIATRFFAEDMDCTFKTKQCFLKTIGQVFDLLVSVSSTCRHAYTSDLSTW